MQFLLDYLFVWLPRPLPVGMTAHKAWASRLCRLCKGLADEESLRWALANQLMHLDSGIAAKSDLYFIIRLRKAASNQIAAGVFQEIKAEQESRKLKQQQEETEAAQKSKASDVSQENQPQGA